MGAQSDSGVTCRCMCKKPRWACSACEMYSTRRSNVLRHIRSAHNGHAEPMTFVQYLADISSGKREIINKKVPPSGIKTKGERLVELIESHEKNQLTHLMDSLFVLTQQFLFTVQANVCKDCLSLAYEIGVSEPENYSFAKHECDLKWTFNYSSLFEQNKSAIIKHLERRVGINILLIMTFLLPPCQHAIFILPEKDLEYFRSAKKDYELIRRSSKVEDYTNLAEDLVSHYNEKEKKHLQSLELKDTITTLDAKEFFIIEHLASQQRNAVLQANDIVTALQILKRNKGMYRIQSTEGEKYFRIYVI